MPSTTIDTIFGTLIHDCAQKLLKHKQEQKEIDRFERTWKKFFGIYKKYIILEQWNQFFLAGKNILKNIRSLIEKEFGIDYEVLSIEELLYESIEGFKQKFKAFVDLIILDKQHKRVVILDLKTCSTSFMFKRYANAKKERQLVLYKYFYCQKIGLDPKEVDTIFLLMEKDSGSKKYVELYKVTSGNVKIKNHLKVLNESLQNLNNLEIFPKNRLGCHFCVYKNTKYCSSSF